LILQSFDPLIHIFHEEDNARKVDYLFTIIGTLICPVRSHPC